MTPFSSDQWIILILILLLGLLLGMFLMAGRGWKRRYQEERIRSDALEAENKRLRTDGREMDSLRNAADRNPGRDPLDRGRF